MVFSQLQLYCTIRNIPTISFINKKQPQDHEHDDNDIKIID